MGVTFFLPFLFYNNVTRFILIMINNYQIQGRRKMKYEDVLKKVRRLSLKERKELNAKGYNCLKMKADEQDEVLIFILELMFNEKEIATIDTIEKEIEIFNRIVTETYFIKEQEVKN